jgi:hypothetical protein
MVAYVGCDGERRYTQRVDFRHDCGSALRVKIVDRNCAGIVMGQREGNRASGTLSRPGHECDLAF